MMHGLNLGSSMFRVRPDGSFSFSSHDFPAASLKALNAMRIELTLATDHAAAAAVTFSVARYSRISPCAG